MYKMGDSTPICRCRVLYLGSAVPRQSKDGLQGIQEPLKSLYPSEGAIGAKGIDSWLSVWSNGILLENVDENRKQVTRFFPIDSLHYCAAVRQVLIPERGNSNPEPKFLPLDSPFARTPKAQHPPIFAAILRRTTGIKVLECHVFICKREAAANALVRCCFHAYADNSYARQLEGAPPSGGSVYGTLGKPNGGSTGGGGGGIGGEWRSRAGSTTTLSSVGRMGSQMNGGGGHHVSNGIGDAYTGKNLYASSADLDVVDDGEGSIYNGDENHKVWSGSQDRLDGLGMEGPYDIYSASGGASTLGRPARARQISAPIPVPPPPKEELLKKKKDTLKKSQKNAGSQSLSGTLIRPKPMMPHHTMGRPHQLMHGQPMPPPPQAIYGPMIHPGRGFHTFSHRRVSGPPILQAHHMGPPPPPPHHGIPHMMLPQQYATLQPPRSKKNKKKDKMNGGIPIGMPVATPLFAYPPPAAMIPEPRPLSMSSRKLAQSAAAGLDDSGNSGAESPGGTGIYRRKGHLNERAFSYSIRQEHRSRSHGSLASLQFNPPDMKKECEIAQMVAGLDLNNGHGHHHQQQQQQHHHHPPPPPPLSHHEQQQNSRTLERRQMIMTNGNSGTFGKPRR